jgi:hypothetical protein
MKQKLAPPDKEKRLRKFLTGFTLQRLLLASLGGSGLEPVRSGPLPVTAFTRNLEILEGNFQFFVHHKLQIEEYLSHF